MVRIRIKPTSRIRGLYRCPDHADHQAERSYTPMSFGIGNQRVPYCPRCGAPMVLVELEVTDA